MIIKYIEQQSYAATSDPIILEFKKILNSEFKKLIEQNVKKIVQIELQIFDDDTEERTTINDIYGEFILWLQQQRVFPILNESIIITNINDFIFPFFKEYSKLLIHEMKKISDNYFSSLKNQCNAMKIIELL